MWRTAEQFHRFAAILAIRFYHQPEAMPSCAVVIPDGDHANLFTDPLFYVLVWHIPVFKSTPTPY